MEDILEGLREAVIHGDKDQAARLAREAVAQGLDPLVAFEQGLRAGISEVGNRFARFEMFLPDLVMGANAMKAAASILTGEIDRRGSKKLGLGMVIMGTVAGDVHDIGKTIAGTLLAANGFDVIDLGVNVPTERFVEAVRKDRPQILGMSSLLTTTAKELAAVIQALKDAGLRDSVKVIVGGGAVTEDYASDIGADGYGHDAELGVRAAKGVLGIA